MRASPEAIHTATQKIMNRSEWWVSRTLEELPNFPAQKFPKPRDGIESRHINPGTKDQNANVFSSSVTLFQACIKIP
jgi:hypothetical protein